MKEIISYLYQLDILEEINYKTEIIYKTINNSYLYRKIDDESKVRNLYKYVTNLNDYSYKFKRNVYNDIISIYQDVKFVLLDIGNNYLEVVDFEDMLSFYNHSSILFSNNIKYKNIWDILWENKIDYLTLHFNSNYELNKNYNLLFNYYLSVGESALEYLLKLKRKYHEVGKISFVHRRIYSPNIKLYFYNPLNYIIDLEIRDIAEYIKMIYYNGEDYLNELNYYLKTHNLTPFEASVLYARIVYPSIFFDDYEMGIIDFKKYINFDDFEQFIKKVYEVISSYTLVDKIDWLN